MKYIGSICVVLYLVISMLGCGGTGTVEGKKVPDWYVKPPEDVNILSSAQTAQSGDVQMAIDKAANQGRADIARQLEDKVNQIEKRFREEIGMGEGAQYLDHFISANKQVTSNVLFGAKIKEQQFFQNGDTYRAYVLVVLPFGAMKEAMLEQIKKNEQMYTRFRSTQVFKELDEEVKKFEEWKKDQQ